MPHRRNGLAWEAENEKARYLDGSNVAVNCTRQ